MAKELGLKMLLPLMNWPSQPVLPGHSFPRDPQLVRELGMLWSSVSRLDEWRIDGVRDAYAGLQLAPGERLAIEAWQRHVGVGWERSVDRIVTYLEIYFPTVADVVKTAGW